MTAIILRILIIAAVLAAIAYGFRRIWLDWARNFREVDKARRQRDLKESKRPDVITLERGKDGTFRPPNKDDERR